MQAKGLCRVLCRIAIIFLLANIVFSERLPKKRGKPDLRAIHSAGLRKLGHLLVAKHAEAPPTVESPMPESESPQNSTTDEQRRTEEEVNRKQTSTENDEKQRTKEEVNRKQMSAENGEKRRTEEEVNRNQMSAENGEKQRTEEEVNRKQMSTRVNKEQINTEGPDVIIDHDHYNDSSCDFDTQTFLIQTPDPLFQLDAEEKVIFYVKGRYTQGLMMRVSVLHEGKTYHDETYSAPANCRDLVQKRFHFLNKAQKPPQNDIYAVDAAVPSHVKKLTVFVSVGNMNHSSNEHCYDLICALYELHFDFLPKPRNIFILSNKPRPIDEGQSANVTCVTKDGNPLAEHIGFRMRDIESGLQIGEVNTTTLELELAIPAAYKCLVLSRAFGKETIVESHLSFTVYPRRSFRDDERRRLDDGGPSVPGDGGRSVPGDGGRSVPGDGGLSVLRRKDPRGKTKHTFLTDYDYDVDQMDKETPSKMDNPKKLESTSTANKVEFVVGLLVSTFVVIVLESHFF